MAQPSCARQPDTRRQTARPRLRGVFENEGPLVQFENVPYLWPRRCFPPIPPSVRSANSSSPLKRLGTPKDIADVVAFVVSEEARWLTGQDTHAGGGVVM